VERMHMISFLSYDLVMSLILAAGFYLGSDTVKAILKVIPSFVTNGMNIAAGMLPALGFALLASMLINKKVAPFLLLGFVLSAYMNVPVLGVALIGLVIVALSIVNNNKPSNSVKNMEDNDNDF
ncbi:PTS sugar transporter subunit IIC, partial [Liquorilactobacillus vini]|uniref:PTS sugar transporter subunit IIC n=1 Tax=Liquorilactobacillus vini TaxID=238015 RepID=UPI00029A6F29